MCKFFKIEKLNLFNFITYLVVDRTSRSPIEGTKRWEIAGNLLLHSM